MVQCIYLGVGCTTGGFVYGDSKAFDSHSVEDGIRGLIGGAFRGRESYRDAFGGDHLSHLVNRKLIARGFQISEDISRKIEWREPVCFKPAVMSESCSYELRHALVCSSCSTTSWR